MYKALVSFSGAVSMSKGEQKEISDEAIVADLLSAGYIEKVAEVKTEKPKSAKKGK